MSRTLFESWLIHERIKPRTDTHEESCKNTTNGLELTEGFLESASCTSILFLTIVQSSFLSISNRSWYILESCANSGSWRIAFGTDLSVIFRFLRGGESG